MFFSYYYYLLLLFNHINIIFSFTKWDQLGNDIIGVSYSNYFGDSISLSSNGTRLAIGGRYNDDAGNNAGHVQVYEYDSSSWNQLGDDIYGEAVEDRSGHSVSLSSDGTRLAIGASENDDGGVSAGHVRVFEFDSSSWIQLGGDMDGEAAGDYFGESVSLSSDGTCVAIGARRNDGGQSNAGHVRVFEFDSSSWSQIGGDIDGDTYLEESGVSVSLSSDGTIVAIGAYRNSDGGTHAGRVEVYQYDSSNWVQLGGDIDGEASEDESGDVVSLSKDGTRVAIGARFNSDGGTNAGHVRVYEYDSSTWNQLGRDFDGETGDLYGGGVSLSALGSILAVGAGGANDYGHVEIYEYDSIAMTWTQVGMNIDGNIIQGAFGTAVSLSSDGSIVAVGAFNADSGRGRVRIFQVSHLPSSQPTGQPTFGVRDWLQVGGDLNGAGQNDYFGGSLSLSSDGTRIAIGAPNNDAAGSDSGYVRVFDYNSPSWVQVGNDISGQSDTSSSGASVSLSCDGTRVVIGSPNNDDVDTDAGQARIFEYDSSSWVQLGGDIEGEVGTRHCGKSVTISCDGNRVGIGTIKNSGQSGLVRLYDYDSSTWAQVGGDIEGEASGDYSGQSVSLSSNGTRVAIGAYRSNSTTGQARVFEFDSSTWVQLGGNINGNAVGDQSGWSVSLSADGTRVAVGAHLSDAGGEDAGSVQIFEYDSSSWNQQGGDIIGEAPGDFSGTSVSLSQDGTRVAIGGSGNDGGGVNAGHVRLYDFDTLAFEWVQIGRDIDGDDDGIAFGKSVALSSDGSILAAGANHHNSGRGLVRIYELHYAPTALPTNEPSGQPTGQPTFGSRDWVQVGGDLAGEAVQDSSGVSVSLSCNGTRIAVGAEGNDGGGSNAGHVRVFDFDSQVWSQLGGDIDGEAIDDKSGVAVSLSCDGSRVAVGARYNDDGGSNAGHVRVYYFDLSSWNQLGGDVDGEEAGDESGMSISLSGDGTRLAVGASFNAGGSFDAGHVRLFEYDSSQWLQLGEDIDGEAAEDHSGHATSLSTTGNRVAIGAYSNDGNGSNSGHVRVFEYIETAWVQVGNNIDGEAGDESGSVVSISRDGTRVAIGTSVSSGHVRVYEYDSLVWVQLGGDIDGENAGDKISCVSLSMDGTRVAIGSDNNNGGGASAGHVRIFDYDTLASAWKMIGTDIDGGGVNEQSGHSVSLSGDGSTVAIGAPEGNSAYGLVRVWKLTYSPSGEPSGQPTGQPTFGLREWIQIGSDIPGEAVGDESGTSVSLSGAATRVAIGGRFNDGGGSDSGHVRVYEYDTSSWIQLGGDIDGEANGDNSGWSVSLSSDGNTVAIGGRYNDGGGSDAGHVRIYRYDSSSWVQLGDDVNGEFTGDESGYSVSLSGDGSRVAIGAHHNGDGGTNAGHVRIFEFDLSTWVQLGGDIDGEAAHDNSGPAVLSSDGARLAIGAINNDGGDLNSGHVRVFEYDSSTWVQIGSDIDCTAADNQCGYFVSLSHDGNRVAIGAYHDNGSGTDFGHVRVFEYESSSSSWNQVGESIVGEAAGDYSGSVSLSSVGTRLAIGAGFNDDGGIDAGHVRVYDFDMLSRSWIQIGADIDGDEASGFFGRSVSLSSDGCVLAIGAPYVNSNTGLVRVWQLLSTPSAEPSGQPTGQPTLIARDWVQLGGDIEGDASDDECGLSVSISADGSRIAVGAPYNDDAGVDAGYVRVFEYEATSWTQVGNDIHGEAADDKSGWSVSLSGYGTRVAIGAYHNDDGGVNAGHVRVYEYDSTSWVQVGDDIDGEAANDHSGSSVSLSYNGTRVAIGAHLHGGSDAGYVRVFQYDATSWIQVGDDIVGEASGDHSGRTVCLSSDGLRVAIEAARNDGGGTDAGHVRVYEYDSSTWVQLGGDIDGEAVGDESGWSVALSGDGTRVAVGARFNDGAGSDAGHVRIFQYDSSGWLQVGDDIDGEAAGDESGFSVSLSRDGSRIAIGGLYNDGGGTDAGHVRVFDYNTLSTTWSLLGEDIDGTAVDGLSGRSVSLSLDGSRLAVGAPGFDAKTGLVRVWQLAYVPTSQPTGQPTFGLRDWNQVGGDIDGEGDGDYSGDALSLSSDGTRVAIGSRYSNSGSYDSGQVRVFQYDSTSWTQLGENLDGEATNDGIGWSVSLSNDGSILAMGAPSNDGGGSNAGHVRVFQYDSSTWIQLGGDIDGESSGDTSGWSVSLCGDGTRVAVGAPQNSGGGSRSGQVRVFEYDSSTWVQLGGDIDGEAGDDWSGFSVSLSSDGTRVAIGAYLNDGNGVDSGHVRVYEYESSNWVQIGSDIDGEAAGDTSGRAVELSSDGFRLAVGASYNDGSGTAAGHVRIFEYNSSAWVQLGDDIDGEGANDESGWSVTLSGDGSRVAVGAPQNSDGGGHVRVYDYDMLSSSWIQIGNDVDGDVESRSGSRVSLSTDGAILAIGATKANDYRGQVRIWRLGYVPSGQPTGQPTMGASDWIQLGGDIEGDASDDECGLSVSISADGSKIAVGAPYNDDAGVDAGYVRVFEYEATSWTQVGNDIHGEAADDKSGWSVSLSGYGTRVAIGAYHNDDGGVNAGHVRVYEYDSTSWVQVGDDIDGEAANDHSGSSVSLSYNGTRVAIGAHLHGGSDAGYVRVFQYDATSWIQVGDDIVGEASGDHSGRTVCLSSDGLRVAIEAARNDGGGTDAGHVRVYEYDSSTWVQLGGDIDGEAVGDESGWSVALSGDGTRVAVGARFNDGAGSDAGHVRIFQYDSSGWLQVGDDIDGEAAGDESGFSVSLSRDGSRIAIGGLYNDGGGTDAGHVRVFDYNTLSTTWSLLGEDIDGTAVDGLSGRSVSLSLDGSRLAVGAPGFDAKTGLVRVWQLAYVPTSQPTGQPTFGLRDWNQVGGDIDGEGDGDYSGDALSLSSDGTRVAIGSRNSNSGSYDSGQVRVFQYDSTSWTQLGENLDGEATNDGMGKTVSLSNDGSILAMGAPSNDGGGSNAGHVRVFQYDSSTWVQLGGDIDGESSGDTSGWSVSLCGDGTRVAVGAPQNSGGGSRSGQVRVFEYDSSTWVQLGGDIDGEAGDDWSGFSVSLSSDGTRVAIGAYLNDGNGVDSGHVRVYEYESSNWVQIGSDIDGEAAGDTSGRAVELSSDGFRLAVGASYNDGSGTAAGHVRIFEYNSSAWVQLGDDIDGEGANDESGWSVTLSGDGSRVAVGAPQNSDGGGHVRVYDYDMLSSSWIQIGNDVDGDVESRSGSRVSLSTDGTILAIGATKANDYRGQVRIWRLGYVPSGQPTGQPTFQPTQPPSAQPSTEPSSQPTGEPSIDPSGAPSAEPTALPSGQPSGYPSSQPSAEPSAQPTDRPSGQPSTQPSSQPSSQPTQPPSTQPSTEPSSQPTGEPSIDPSSAPSAEPTALPSRQPSGYPSSQPSAEPSAQPTDCPSGQPSTQPSSQPSSQPTQPPSAQPSTEPSSQPTGEPSIDPSSAPSAEPTALPSGQPSWYPSSQPSAEPSAQPTDCPSGQPSTQPSSQPSSQPTQPPSAQPSTEPSSQPTGEPSIDPSGAPSAEPTALPSGQPSGYPSPQPSAEPSAQPTDCPSGQPSTQPSSQPSSQPTQPPSAQPSTEPSSQPTGEPSIDPSSAPSAEPTALPSGQPSWYPSSQPSAEPSAQPTDCPSGQPSTQPSSQPSSQPTQPPSAQPSTEPSSQPTGEPSIDPSSAPSAEPTALPSGQPSGYPSSQPSAEPSAQPTDCPSGQPSTQPSSQPSSQPTQPPSAQPSTEPSSQPTGEPSIDPSSAPSAEPTALPSGQPSGYPSPQPSAEPSAQPTDCPSGQPSTQPSSQPSSQPTQPPSAQPSTEPSSQPTGEPSIDPSGAPSAEPTALPSGQPSGYPSPQPSAEPSAQPTDCPSGQPSTQPSSQPSSQPTQPPSAQPSTEPSSQPTGEPSIDPSGAPSAEPTALPSGQPSGYPSPQPSAEPSAQPTDCPSGQPSTQPSSQPSSQPTQPPSAQPSTEPSSQPTGEPSIDPSSAPSAEPTALPSGQPTGYPSPQPSAEPSAQPTDCPSGQPSTQPSSQPSSQPTQPPSAQPSTEPSSQPTGEPSIDPSSAPSAEPTALPSGQPSGYPSPQPSAEPSAQPTDCPSGQPSTQPSSQPSKRPVTSSPTSNGATNLPTKMPTVSPTFSPTIPMKDPPGIESCHFSNDGSYIKLVFDVATDRGNFERSHQCEIMLDFPHVGNAMCRWSDDSILRVFPAEFDSFSVPSLVQIGDILRVKDNIARSKCPSEAKLSECSKWSTSSNLECVVSHPVSPSLPSVSISSPSVVSSCNSFTLDISTSTGSGGRPWSYHLINVTSVSRSNRSLAYVSKILAFYQNDYSMFPPTALKAGYLMGNETYVFTVILCNFLQQCNYGMASVDVVNMEAMPMVTISGSNFRRVKRSQTLSLLSSASIASCNASKRVWGLSPKWQVLESGVINNQLTSTSRSPFKFLLSGSLLGIEHVYIVTVIVTDTLYGESSSASVEIEVVPSGIRAIISGGADKLWHVGDGPITVDGSGSYDPDDVTSLAFYWSCDESISHVYLPPSFCSALFPPEASQQQGSSRQLFLNTSFMDFNEVIGSSFLIQLRIEGSHNRSDMTFVTYTIFQSTSPKITFLSDPPRKLNALQQVELLSSVEVRSTDMECLWSVNDHTIDLAAISLTPFLSARFTKLGSYVFNLVIQSFTLDPGSTYVFKLSVRNMQSGITATTVSVSVQIVEAPRSGRIEVSPLVGVEMLDFFQFSTSQWTNDELPLSYSFGYYSKAETKHHAMLELKGRSEFMFLFDQFLPGGIEALNYSLVCGVYAFNALDARSQATQNVQVTKAQSTTEEFTASILSQLTEATLSQDVGAVNSVVSVGMSVLNGANCSLAPACESLGRHDCSQTAHTCGKCLAGLLGQNEDDDNSPCYTASSAVASETSLGGSCNDISDCMAMQICNNSQCVYSMKSCPSDCSGHGRCRFIVKSSSELADDCLVNDFTCAATCSCDSGYQGKGCSETQSNMVSKQEARYLLILALNDTLQYEDITLESVSGLSLRVKEAGSNPSELLDLSCDVLHFIISDILVRAVKVKAAPSIIADLYVVLDNCNDVYVAASAGDTTLGLAVDSWASVDKIKKVRENLNVYTSEFMIAGEKNKAFVNSYSRSSLSKNVAGLETVQSVPTSLLESYFSNPKSTAHFDGVNIVDDSSATRTIILEENVGSLNYNGSQYTSNSLKVQQHFSTSGSSDFAGLRISQVLITMQNELPQEYITSNSTVNATQFITHCSDENVTHTFNYTCPDGEVVSHLCFRAAEVITSTCPSPRYLPVCLILSSNDDGHFSTAQWFLSPARM